MTREEDNAICDKRFSRDVYDKLRESRVAVAGLGGLGSHIAVMLARSCIGTLHLIDFDVVDISNLNRQEYYVSHIGRAKTECMKEKLLEINPFLNVITSQVKVTEDNLREVFREEKIVCEAFDRADQKAMLVNGLLTAFQRIQIISGSGMAGYGDANAITTRKVFSNFYLCGDGVTDSQTVGLMAPRVSICAGHQANKVLQLILKEK